MTRQHVRVTSLVPTLHVGVSPDGHRHYNIMRLCLEIQNNSFWLQVVNIEMY
ncbi:hypothetical protein DPMN_031982 [Dreissena polymorpha]|uniref:Uncharacterized protein n=1 Tax=Dreissena polymorpha TaxID=45954 RepID=A0A9D4RIH9_DREPO|nr:hypothetical protein DPMN_031982 [Dreissena polymorpha]